ncbi:MAG: hypothetical protein QOI48_2337 [Solirubrobacteraceae bacterium]|nr:hypothetical protein [Solirubrobacteraceae bacterium]
MTPGPGTSDLPALAFARARSAPPPGSIQFYDGYFSALDAGKYTIGLNQKVAAPSGTQPQYGTTQVFEVVAPEFAIDPDVVHTAYPPAGATGVYDEQLPFVVLGDPSLPWERAITPGGGAPDSSDPTPWIALVIFADGEIALQQGSSNPVGTTTVSDLLAPDRNVLKPQIPTANVSAAVLASHCQTITIPGTVFNAVMPGKDDLRYLAHTRAVSHPDQGDLLLSVVLSNRLPVAEGAPLRYYAQLVSVEGFQDYLGPNAKPIPPKPSGGAPQDVKLVSLSHWTFTSQPETGLSFRDLMAGLIASEQVTPALRLPAPPSVQIPPAAATRIQDGYAPLSFVTGTGEQSFAWYRGPFTPVVPQPLPQVGDPPVGVDEATSADSLMIYHAEQGLFDLSYAAAWNIGRQLALADAQFAQQMSRYRREARSALGRLAQRMAAPHLAGVDEPADLLEPDAARQRFVARVGDGLASRWTEAMGAARAGERPPPDATHRVPRARRRAAVHPATVLEQPWAGDVLGDHLAQTADPVSAWLAKLSLLGSVPFSYLVADPRMLPAESIRFFYLDRGWIDALVAGATSIAVHSTADVALLGALRPRLHDAVAAHRVSLGAPAGGTAMTGMLLRSALVSNWPALVVRATLGGAPLPIVRSDCPSPSVRLCLFDGVPDEVSLAEPYQGLVFGLEDGVVGPRNVTAPSVAGAQIANVTPVKPTFRTPPANAAGGVLQVAPLAAALETAVGVRRFSSKAVVNWNGTALQTSFVSASRLDATVPAALIASAGTAEVTVAAGGATSYPAPFTIDPPLAIDALAPSMVAAGGPAFMLVVDGVGFGPDSEVRWNGTALETKVVNSSEVTAAVPANLISGAGSARIEVAAGEKTTPAAQLAIVAGGPAISELEPSIAAAGSGGFTLTLVGSGFEPTGTAVNWNGAPLVTKFLSPTEVSATVPGNMVATSGVATVTATARGITSSGKPFTIGGAQPQIGSFEQAVAIAGANGFDLVVRGINFGNDTVVTWNGTALKTTWDDSKQVTAAVPASVITAAGAAAVTVKSGGHASPPASFVVIAPTPGVGLLEPSSVVAGGPQFTLSVTGGFGAGDFAIQMVNAPELQSFIATHGEKP